MWQELAAIKWADYDSVEHFIMAIETKRREIRQVGGVEDVHRMVSTILACVPINMAQHIVGFIDDEHPDIDKVLDGVRKRSRLPKAVWLG